MKKEEKKTKGGRGRRGVPDDVGIGGLQRRENRRGEEGRDKRRGWRRLDLEMATLNPFSYSLIRRGELRGGEKGEDASFVQ